MQRTLITVVGSRHAADLAAPSDLVVHSLMPLLLSACEDFTPETVGPHLTRWQLRLDGGVVIQPEQSLREAGVFDGARLILRTAGSTSGGATYIAPVAHTQRPAPPQERQSIVIRWDNDPER